MKKIQAIIVILLFFISFPVFGDEIIDNKRTNEYKNINGTKISLIPPKGFIDGVNFLGLQQAESGSSIMVVNIPAGFSQIAPGITKENLLTKGVEVSQIENIKINNLPALFITGTQHAYGTTFAKYILLFGTEKESITINAIYPENFKEIGKEIKKSMLSVFYEANKEINPFEVLDYSIDVSKTKLKFANNIGNMILFSVDGNIPTLSQDKTSLMVGKSFSQVSVIDKKLFCINNLKQMPFIVDKIYSTNKIIIDDISGYEIYAKVINTDLNQVEYVYQVILFSDNLYYCLLGTTLDKTNNSIQEIKNAIKTFKRK